MALVQRNVCEPFERISQSEVLARILAEDVEPDELSASDTEIEPEERGKDFPLLYTKYYIQTDDLIFKCHFLLSSSALGE